MGETPAKTRKHILMVFASSPQNKPVALPVQPANIPDTLRALPCWVVWRFVPDVDKETEQVQHYDKPPLCTRGGPASSTNPSTWSTFADALSAYERGGLDGIGLALSPSPDNVGDILVAVDLDHCRDCETGAVEDWAQEIIDALSTYTEASPSGEGIRMFLRGQLPPHGRKRGNIECYCNGRYVTVTGHHVAGTPTRVESRNAEMLAVHKKVFPEVHQEPTSPKTNGDYRPLDLSDIELIEKAKAAKNGHKFAALWTGDTSGYSSASEADLALCRHLAFWCGPHQSDRLDALFRQSGLYRSKWNRLDYRQRTIALAYRGLTDSYTPAGVRLQSRQTDIAQPKPPPPPRERGQRQRPRPQ